MTQQNTRPCIACGKAIPNHYNYCDWDCHVAFAKKMGGSVNCPNNLPVRSINCDWSMWEHEHGDHPTYMFPVDVDYVGVLTDDHRKDYVIRTSKGQKEPTDEVIRRFHGETHALIYTDGIVALTMHESAYTLWRVKDGSLMREHAWYKKDDYRMSTDSLNKIKAQYEV